MADSPNLKATWIDRGLEPKVKPDPRFPDGVDIDATLPGKASCQMALPCPAKRIGYYLIDCSLCGLQALLTTAGRPDDPRSVRLNCKIPELLRAES